MAKAPRKASGFGARLRQLREARGLTLSALGELLEVSPQAVAKYEQGTEPTWPVVLRLAEALGVSTEEFRPPPKPARPPGRKKGHRRAAPDDRSG